MTATPKDIGAHVKAVKSANPANDAGGTTNGAAIDRMGVGDDGFLSCVLVAECGAASGSPSSFTYDAKLQDSPDGSTDWLDISGASVTQVTANNTLREKDINLAGARRHIRVVRVVAFVAGTTPALPVAEAIVLGGAFKLPAA
jgi:hypothetical protein